MLPAGTSYARLAVVEASRPDQITGQALRIGYVSSAPNALALYRLKIRYNEHIAPSRAYILLEGIFVLESHVFSLFSPTSMQEDEHARAIQ